MFTITIALWAWLFCQKLALEIFSPAKKWAYSLTTRIKDQQSLKYGVVYGIYKAVFVCACCHAGWLSIFSLIWLHTTIAADICSVVVAMAVAEILSRSYD
jgi:hypothetical protein